MAVRGAVLLSLIVVGVFADDPVVVTPLGAVRGSVRSSWKNNDFLSFRGIRYAEAPVGELRFQPPVPVSAWEGEYNATEDGPICQQPGGGSVGPQSEDCLFLNVYTREINLTKPKPVLVWLHPGGFYSLTGRSSWVGADYLMDQPDIVLVTLNYRLATLGFFSTGDERAPGNYGMKDQVAALRWVRDNIQSFGGDPKNVTLGGYSAGAASVLLHMVSPMSKGLFSKGIAMSGSSTAYWAVNRDPLYLAKEQADLMGCPTDDVTEMVHCVKNMSAPDTARIYSRLWTWGYDPMVVLSPVVEADRGDGSERFLTEDPVVSLQKGDFLNIPLIIGSTKDEMAHRALFVIENSTWLNDMSDRWDQVAPIPFMFEPNSTISSELRREYIGDIESPLTNASLPILGQLYADSIIIFGIVRGAKLVAAKSSAPVYVYQFTYQGPYSNAYWPGTNIPYGVVHHDDLNYLFYAEIEFPKFNTTGKDAAAVERSTTLWANFIKSGNPTPMPEDVLGNASWTPYTPETPTYLEIGDKLRNHVGLYYQNRMEVWERLFPL